MGEENGARLLELAAMAEAASGPDRELDLAIACTADPMFTQLDECVRERVARLVLQPYTASLDAAMTLVPEPQSFSLRHCGNTIASVQLIGGDPCERDPEFEAHAATPALALTASALRARAKGNIS